MKKHFIYCLTCKEKAINFVAILKKETKGSTEPCNFYCIDCYERELCQITTKQKELTMKNGSLNGSTKSSASKPKDNHSLEVWEENILETLNSTSETENLWEKLNTEINRTFPTRSQSSKEET